ncbi:MAG: glycosyltransferase [Planctomycetota bacterium]|nr:glycosyltransferase [Planctomycetota bacterium]
MNSSTETQADTRITAAICAYNAAHHLADVVNSVMAQTLPADAYEVLVVDNNSTDETTSVLHELQERFGHRLRMVSETQQGLSHARNRALAQAAAPLIAFLDADAVAEEPWLKSLADVFDAHPRAGVVGGRIEVQWDAPKPRWWDDRLDEAMGRFSPSGEQTQLRYPRFPYGGNFAVRSVAIDEVGGFLTHLGRSGAGLLAGEEGELCLRMEQHDWEIHYTPAAPVHHRATGKRLTRRFILRRAFNHGRTQYMLEARHGFESGLYLSRARVLSNLLANLIRVNWNLPYLKFICFRIGYHYQRTISERPQPVLPCPGVA